MYDSLGYLLIAIALALVTALLITTRDRVEILEMKIEQLQQAK